MTPEHRSILNSLVAITNGLSPDSTARVRQEFRAGWTGVVAQLRAQLAGPAGAGLLADLRTAAAGPVVTPGFGSRLATEQGLFRRYDIRHPIVGRRLHTVFHATDRMGLAVPTVAEFADARVLADRVQQLVAGAVSAISTGLRASDRGASYRTAQPVLRAQYFLLGVAALMINLYEADADIRPVSLAYGRRLHALAALEPFRRVG